METSLVTPPRVPSSAGRKWWRQIALGAVILVCGILLGHVLALHWIHHRFEHIARNPEALADHLIFRIRQELALTPEEAAAVRAVLLEQHRRFEEIHQEMMSRMQKEVTALRDAVAGVLPAEKADVWRREYKRILPPPPPPPPSPPPPPGPPPGDFF